MSTDDWDEIEAALTSAEEGGLLSERGRSLRSPGQKTILQRYNERIGSKLVAGDRSDLDEIREEYQAEERRFNEAKKDMAIERSSGRLAMLQSRVAASREATEDITSRSNQAPDSNLALGRGDRIYLDVATHLRLKSDIVVDHRELEPWANRVKVRDAWPRNIDHLGLDARVGFVFYWINPFSWSVVLDVGTAVALNGFCNVGAGSTLLGVNSVSVNFLTFLQPSVPYTPLPSFQSGQTVNAGEVSASGGGFLGLGEVDSLEVAGYYGMRYQSFVVPGGQLAIFDAGLYFFGGAGSGPCSAEVDFSSGDFLVLCPVVDLTILAP